jgi:endonuclease-3
MASSRLALRSLLETSWERLSPLWPEAVPLLHYRNCFELLCAVMLSAQCTDDQVNRVTPGLFARWPDASALSKASLPAVEEAVHSVGFWRTKARHLVETAALLIERHQGEVPRGMEELCALPGVGRKTANLVISACFGQPGLIVDTHVLRVSYRLGLSEGRDPDRVEAVLAELVPRDRWTRLSHALNRHGKHVCTARKPACADCPLADICQRRGLGVA